MKMRLSMLCLALVSQSVLAQQIEMKTTPIDLGVVNGEVVNDYIQIKKTLRNPILISVNQDDYAKPLSELLIKDATLIKQSPTEIVVEQQAPLSGNTEIKTQFTLGLWVDGERVPFKSKYDGSGTSIEVPKNYKEIKVQSVQPAVLIVQREYRGEFNSKLEIVGK
ncbi:DUF5462 family protein [Vibrio harveyi]